ncbi:GlxA family transcriptional regulator [Jannaschia sp. M317]|uniref:GlxA family transcriptional regulator n=1 Tax=Jannaschia sp. M317 TaxID=2867011 RepID=UPI0021A9543C|nr:helix-turn-helix domain-containing protein [Jannaschia sp. M317]UWQ17616.1 DJ-1/PfpI family protein [Jannaschia sp. M317]
MNPHNQTEHIRSVHILGFDGVLVLDVAGPAQVFASTNKVLGWKAYDIVIATERGRDVVTDTGLALRSDVSFAHALAPDVLVVPGGPGVDQRLDDPFLLHFLKDIEPRVGRFVSICSGSLLTASAGLLDHKRATTHWERTHLAHKRFPAVDWQLNDIFTRDGKFHCSAGVTAGIDLALSLVEADHGRRVALGVAREMVVFMQRQGGQSQYSAPLKAQATSSKRLGDLYQRIEQDPTAAWNVQGMAKIAGTTERTLHRDFMQEFGQPPSRFIEERRLAIARQYLEGSRKSVKEIASLSGFVTEQKMRRSFVKLLGILPTDYRDRFGGNRHS